MLLWILCVLDFTVLVNEILDYQVLLDKPLLLIPVN